MANTNFRYFSSNDVKIYPTARRGTFTVGDNDDKTFTYDPEARLNTEYNTTNGFSKTPEKQSYVVEYVNNDNILKCVIGGYYFEIKNFNNYLINKPQYLIIRTTTVNLINTTSDTRTTQLLMSLEDGSTETNTLDNNGEFTGLAYTNKANIATNYTYLKLFTDDACTQLNQEAYLDTSLVKTGTGKHSIVGTFGFENSSEILSPNNIPDTNINTGSGDYSITFGSNNENNGDYSLVYGSKIANNGDNNIVISVNSAKNTITGNNNILIGENIVATENQLILNKIEKVTICNGSKNVLDYSAENGFKLGENLVTISKTSGLVLTTEDANYINLIKVDTGDHIPFRLTLDKNKEAELVIDGNISAHNIELSGTSTLSGVTQITMANGGTIDNSSGNIFASNISATQSHLGTADAKALVVNENARVKGIFNAGSVVTNSASVSGAATVESLRINQTATGRGISFGNNAQIRYDATNKRLEIIC